MEQLPLVDTDLYRTIVTGAGVGIMITQDGIITFINPAIESLTGYCAAELIGQSVQMITHPNDQLRLHTQYSNRMAGIKDPPSCEFRMLTKQNETVWLELRASRIEWRGKSASLCIVNKLNEHRQLSLAAAEKRYYDMCDFLPQAMFEADRDLGVTYANGHARAMFGYSREDLENGINILSMIAPEEQCLARTNIEKILLKGETIRASERRAIRKDGSTFPILIFAAPIIENNVIVGIRAVYTDITDLVEVREKYRIAHRQMFDIIEFQPDPTFVIDLEGKVIAWNRAIEKLSGVNKNEMIGEGDFKYALPFYHERRPILIDMVPEMQDPASERYKNVWRDNGRVHAEIFIPHLNNGEGGYLWGVAAPLYDQDGRLNGAIEMIRDITQLKHFELQLKKNEELFRTFVEQDADGIVLVEENGLICEWNSAMTRITGYDSEETVGKQWDTIAEALIHPDRDPIGRIKKLMAGFQRMRTAANGNDEKNNTLSNEGKIRTKSGNVVYIQQTIFRIQTGNGFRVGSTIRDISETRAIQNALLQTEWRFRQIADNVDEGFLIIDLDTHRILYANNAMDAMYETRLINGMLEDLFARLHPEDRDSAERRILDKKTDEWEYRIIRSNGEIRWLNSRAFFVTASPGNAEKMIGITKDVTLIKKAAYEAELHRLQMIEKDKMATLGVLASGVTHEINNPNNYLMLNAKILERVWNDILPILEKHYARNRDFKLADLRYSEARTLLPDIIQGLTDGTQRIKRIVDNLRTYARKDTSGLNMEVDVNAIIDSALVLLSNLIQKSTDNFTVQLNPDLPRIKGNAQQLEQVVLNLMTNSCQAIVNRSDRIDLRTFENDGFVTIQILDEGTGIPSENMKKIFDPFFTTKRESGGTGLGLSISWNIIRNHGGTIEFSSTPGKGTTATLRLPAISRTANSQESL